MFVSHFSLMVSIAISLPSLLRCMQLFSLKTFRIQTKSDIFTCQICNVKLIIKSDHMMEESLETD